METPRAHNAATDRKADNLGPRTRACAGEGKSGYRVITEPGCYVGAADERPRSIHVIKQAEQGVIPNNPSAKQSVQQAQATGQRFCSEESDGRGQVMTELSDYTGETVGNEAERFNVEQINEGVVYANGGVGMRGHSPRNDYMCRAKHSVDTARHPGSPHAHLAESASTKLIRVSPTRSHGRSTKHVVLMRDIDKLQAEVMGRKQRLEHQYQQQEDESSILPVQGEEPVPPVSHFVPQKVPDMTGTHDEKSERGNKARHIPRIEIERNVRPGAADSVCDASDYDVYRDFAAAAGSGRTRRGASCSRSDRHLTAMCLYFPV